MEVAMNTISYQQNPIRENKNCDDGNDDSIRCNSFIYLFMCLATAKQG
jgi:hypothetical protein